MEDREDYPLVTVHMSAYNHEKYIAEAIESIINQTYENLEFIIINDGSKDNTHLEISKLISRCHDRFKKFEYRNRENKGLSATKNECVEWAKGKYFTGLASDDVMLPNKISLLVEKLESLDESYAVAFGDAIFIDENSSKICLNYSTGGYTTADKGTSSFLDYYTNKRNFDYKNEKFFGSYQTLLGGNYLPAMSTVLKLEQIKEVDAWTSGNTIEDWEMWLKLSKNYNFAYIDKPVALYRWHDSNSCKLITKNLIYDELMLFKNEKKYALDNNLKDLYYENLVNYSLKIRQFSKRDFIVEMLNYFYDIDFMKSFFKKLVRRIIK